MKHFPIPISSIDSSIRHKNQNKANLQYWQMELVDIYKAFHPTACRICLYRRIRKASDKWSNNTFQEHLNIRTSPNQVGRGKTKLEENNFETKLYKTSMKEIALSLKKKIASILTQLTKTRRYQINKTSNEWRDIAMDAADIKRIISNCYKWLFANKLDNKKKMQILNICNLPKLNHKDLADLNTSVTKMEIQSVVNILPIMKSLVQDDFMLECYQTFKE